MSTDDSKVLGVVLLVRHGDRSSFYQNPSTYTPSLTEITPLGNKQEFMLGSYLRDLYLNETSPSHIQGLSNGLFNQTQVLARADAGGEGGVIFSSAISLLQGMWPPTKDHKIVLANGTTVEAPLGGHQNVPIESVEPDNDISLEGWTQCRTFENATAAYYNSTAFKSFGEQHADFLKSLPPYLDGRPVTFQNMWNVFDYMNVNSLHSAEFFKNLPATYLEKARHLANFHEYGVFSSADKNAISNIAGQTIIPSILNGFEDIVSSKSPVKFVYEAISYKPFISLFSLTGAAQASPELAGVVNFAGALALEVRQTGSNEPVIRFNFKNGTDAATFTQYNIFGQNGDVPLSMFINNLAPVAINTTAEWCSKCANKVDRGCAELEAIRVEAQSKFHQSGSKISPVGAGFLGAGLTLAVAAMLLLGLFFCGLLMCGKRSRRVKDEKA